MSKGALDKPCYSTFLAGADLTEGTAVKFGAGANVNELTVVPVTAAADFVLGIVYGDDRKNGEEVTIYREGGEAHVLAGGAIAKGDPLKINAAGRVIKATSDDKGVIGYAMDAGAANGDWVRFYFTRFIV